MQRDEKKQSEVMIAHLFNRMEVESFFNRNILVQASFLSYYFSRIINRILLLPFVLIIIVCNYYDFCRRWVS